MATTAVGADRRYGHRIAPGAPLVGVMSAASARLSIGRTASLGDDRVRFVKPVFFGDAVTTEYRITAGDREKRRVHAELTCVNQRGELGGSVTHIRALVG